MKIIGWSKVTRARRGGELGARAFVRPSNPHGRDVPYEIDTHGLSGEALAERLAELEERHEKWARRIAGFGAVIGVELVVDGEVFRIIDCTVPAGSLSDVTLYVDVRRIQDPGGGGETRHRVGGWPVELRFASIDVVPADVEIIGEVRRRLQEDRGAAAAHVEYTQRVARLMGGR